MKKYILSFMSVAMLMTMASCSSSDDEVAENKNAEGKLVPMTFTATQEANAGTRSALDNNNVIWKSGDIISVFDGTGSDNNHVFTLQGTEETTSGSFSGTASETATSYTAVYPYTGGAKLNSDGSVSDIILPAEQTATLNSFDPAAALMMAVSTESNKNQLNFKNAVSLVKIKTDFACKKIVLTANEYIAGTGTLTMTHDKVNNTYTSSFSFTSGNSQSITLKPATGGENIAAGTYYIVVPPTTLSGFSISFTASDDNVYTRKSTKSNTFNRSKIKDFGSFATTGDYWYDEHRGDKVRADQEVDMGLTVSIGGVNYKVIFAKTNLTATGLAENETDYGDYFAWGALEPWCTAYTRPSTSEVTPTAWKTGKESGYESANNPTLSKEYSANDVLSTSDDPARQILGGDWQLPRTEIWVNLYDNGNNTKYEWDRCDVDGYSGYKVTRVADSSKSIFLPAAGDVDGTSFYNVGSNGYYWSGTAYSSTRAYGLYFYSGNVNAQNHFLNRYLGFSVRPVRLVAVN